MKHTKTTVKNKKVTSKKKPNARKAKALAKLKRNNKKFLALPSDQKAIAVAEDVLNQLKIKKLIAKQGRYVNHESLKGFMKNIKGDMSADLQRNYDKIEKCQVCALGSCVMAAAKLGNTLSIEDVWQENDDNINNNKTNALMLGIFSPHQLLLIESAFERYSTSNTRFARNIQSISLENDEIEKVNSFYEKFKTPSARLKAIMKNIIKNKGVFIP